jgi:hypothetical protein
MAARRLLIVMLVLLGLSTLAAALVPQHSLRDGTTSGTTTTQPTQSTTTAEPPPGRSLEVQIAVGKKVPVVADTLCDKRKRKCEPLHVGDQLSLQVLSKRQTELEVPRFGLIGVASPNAPAFFQLLPQEPGTIGVIFTSSRQVAARIEVLSAKAAAKAIRKKASSNGSRSKNRRAPSH